MKRHLGFALKLLLSVALIAYMAVTFDLGDAAQRIRQADMAWIAAAIALFVVLMANNALRWEIVIAAITVATKTSSRVKPRWSEGVRLLMSRARDR